MGDKRVILMTGSLRKPLFRYIVGAHITYNPFSYPNGTHFYNSFVKMAQKFENKRLLDDYVWSHKEHMNPRFSEG
jgi:hypothetical protein